MSKNKVWWLTTIILMVFSLVLASCGKATPTTTPTTTSATKSTTTLTTTTKPTITATTTTTTTKPSADQPKYGGHLRYAYTDEPSSFDPHTAIAGGDAVFWRQMFDTLVGVDFYLVPAAERSLAESWEFPDNKTMVFHLRKGVKFQDDTEFDANAVKFNIQRILDPATKAVSRSFFLPVASVEIVDKNTVKFNLSGPWPAGMGHLPGAGGYMNSPTAVQKYGKEYGFKPCGTGPFKLLDFTPGSSCVMEKNPNFWGKDKVGNSLPYPDKLTIFIIPDETVRSAAFEAGKVDLAYLPAKDLDKFEANNKFTIVKFEGAKTETSLHFNRAKAPMDNVYLRKAVAYAVNWGAINQAIYFGRNIVAKGGLWLPGTWVYDETVPRPSYDPAKAKEYLKLGGMPSGFNIDMICTTVMSETVQMVQADLAKIGINARINVFDAATCTTKYFVNKEFPLYLTPWSRRPEPDWIATQLYKSDGYYNASKLPDTRVDDLVIKGASEYDTAKRKTIYRQLQEITLDECWVVPGLYTNMYWGYWKNKIGGVENFFTWDTYGDLRYVWVK